MTWQQSATFVQQTVKVAGVIYAPKAYDASIFYCYNAVIYFIAILTSPHNQMYHCHGAASRLPSTS